MSLRTLSHQTGKGTVLHVLLLCQSFIQELIIKNPRQVNSFQSHETTHFFTSSMTWRKTTRCYTPLLVPSPAKPTLQRATPPPRRTRSARRIGQHKRTPHLHAPTPNLDHMLSAATLIRNEELTLTQILI